MVCKRYLKKMAFLEFSSPTHTLKILGGKIRGKNTSCFLDLLQENLL